MYALFGELAGKVMAGPFDPGATDTSVDALIDYGQSRLPALFDENGHGRGPAIYAISSMIDEINRSEVPVPAFPPDPLWVAKVLNPAVPVLLKTLAEYPFDTPIPDSTVFLEQRKRSRRAR